MVSQTDSLNFYLISHIFVLVLQKTKMVYNLKAGITATATFAGSAMAYNKYGGNGGNQSGSGSGWSNSQNSQNNSGDPAGSNTRRP